MRYPFTPYALLLILLSLCAAPASAMEPFVIDNIKVEGLQRISVGTVYNYLPLQKGERVDSERSSAAVRALFKTGFFKDVVLEREGDTLVVFVAERPAIASVEFEGNDDIPTDQLESNLKLLGLSEGKIFNRSLLDKVRTELQRQYLVLGKYNARVRTEVLPRERNRVALRIEISEGEVASIHHLNIIGNKAISEDELREKFILSNDGGWFGGDDQYSKQKLNADLATLRAYYLDRGYINFRVDSTQVTITPDKRHVYITINVSEGEQYRISEITLSGDTLVPKEELRELITLQRGEIFSRKELTESTSRISSKLGDNGYAFANINPIPRLDDEKREVALNVYIDPGERVYVRRINISGNTQTQGEVLRREMRQMEGGWISTTKVERSRTRLNRLGFFDDVKVATPSVPGSSNQVDLDMTVAEREAFGSFSAGVGYGDASGLVFNLGVDWENFLGSGQRVGINFNNSDVNTEYSFSVYDPYYTMDGVSRTLKAAYQESDTTATGTTSYTSDNYSAGIAFGVPVSEYDTVRYSFDYKHTTLYTTGATTTTTTDTTSQRILDFCDDTTHNADDCAYGTYKFAASWSRDTRDRTIFPTEGGMLSAGAELALGGSSLLGDDYLHAPQFYKLTLEKKHYIKLHDYLTIGIRGEASYAETYGGSSILPPYERYYAGGVKTLRGYRTNRLFSTAGTLDENGLPYGGNARLLGGAELLFPPPFEVDSKSLRFSAFLDAGNVYNTSEGVDLDELRMTYGISMNWYTPVGPLIFSYGMPLNAKDGDYTERFQFSLGLI